MGKPLVTIVSNKPQFTTELPILLHDCFEFTVCDTPSAARAALRNAPPAMLVADLDSNQDGGHQAATFIEYAQTLLGDEQILVLTAEEAAEPLLRLLACSAITYFQGSVDSERLAALLFERTAGLGRSLSTSEHTPDDSAEEAADSTVSSLDGITRRFETRTPAMAATLDELEVAARHDVTILLIGETGSGKTFLSKLIHEVSPRSDEPFLHVACGALPAELIESELFGHVKGAFTSAHADKEGKFVAAAGGTILLDEIDVLGPEQQVKLLRVIETGEFEPVGSNRTIKSRARLVVASNLDLQPLVEQGKFRPDLYYRLNMLKFDVAPLRQRPADIEPLARNFIGDLSRKHNVQIRRIDRGLFEALKLYPWPGNVRELENVIQRAVIYSRDGVLSAQHLPQHIVAGKVGPTNDPSIVLKSNDAPIRPKSLGSQVALSEREIIEQTLFRNNFSRTNTARDLGISRVTLYNKMKKYGMTRS